MISGKTRPLTTAVPLLTGIPEGRTRLQLSSSGTCRVRSFTLGSFPTDTTPDPSSLVSSWSSHDLPYWKPRVLPPPSFFGVSFVLRILTPGPGTLRSRTNSFARRPCQMGTPYLCSPTLCLQVSSDPAVGTTTLRSPTLTRSREVLDTL